ncbi:MAG: type II secretion system protein [Methylobacter sp.]|nr:type II secretion system protein [Methylobacter sp.]
MSRVPKYMGGFTLIEAVMVIVITGILGALVSSFATPLKGYFDATARADLSDVADTALRRMARDVRLALPNSVRVNTSGGDFYLDFLATTGGGRYRAVVDSTGAGDPLDFSAADTSFDVLGSTVDIAANDQIVVYNLGVSGADAYEGNTAATHVRRAASAVGAGLSSVSITSSNRLPFDSPAHRFQIVHEQVRYICDLATGRLTRYAGFTIATPTATVPADGSSALLASGVTACSFAYVPGVTQRASLITISLTLSKSGESVTLLHQVHVQNVP